MIVNHNDLLSCSKYSCLDIEIIEKVVWKSEIYKQLPKW